MNGLKYCLLFLLFTCSIPEQTTGQSIVDSLQTALRNHPKEDIQKVALYNSLAKEYQDKDIKQGLATADAAIYLAQQLKDEPGMAQALMVKGQNYYRQNNYAQATALCEQALEKYKQLADKKGIADCYNTLGNIQTDLSQHTKALEYFTSAYNLNEQIGNKNGMAANMVNAGNVYKALSNYPKAIEVTTKAENLYKQTGNNKGKASSYGNLGSIYLQLSDLSSALSYFQKALKIHEQLGKSNGLAISYGNMGLIYSNLNNLPKALEFHKAALAIVRDTGIKDSSVYLMSIARNFHSLNQTDEAIKYYLLSIKTSEQLELTAGLPYSLNNLGFLYYGLGRFDEAWECFKKGKGISQKNNDKAATALLNLSMGEWCMDAPDSLLALASTTPAERHTKTLEFLNKGKQGATEVGNLVNQRFAWQDLSMAYQKHKDYANAFSAYRKYIVLRDSILNNEKDKKISRLVMQYDFDKQADSLKLEEKITAEKLTKQMLLAKQQSQQILLSNQQLALGKQELKLISNQKDIQQLAFLKTQADLQNEQLQKQEKEKLLIIASKEKKLQQAEALKARDQNRFRVYGLLAALAVFSIIAGILLHNNRNKQKANNLLSEQKQQTEEQKNKVEETLQELKVTQSQLIQREKMASLGELTVGIAHEIKNPLNFVNNFSDLNTELIADLEEEIKNGNNDELLLIASSLKQNMQKINFHGKRADEIVKSMQQHSVLAPGKKERININDLTMEYVQLSYRSFCNTNKLFKAAIITDFDMQLRERPISQQDLPVVLQNLYSNAFYFLAQKNKLMLNGYEPTLWVATKFTKNDKGASIVEIHIKDNGPGIPASKVDKVFQPFFTTKPTGQGTGLGLSLSYDIITQGNNGNISVESKEGEFSAFTIQLPVGLNQV